MSAKVGRMPRRTPAASDEGGRDGARPLRVLLVEDCDADVVLARKAFEHAKFPLDLRVVGNGLDAMAFVRGRGRFSGESLPDLVLLDLGLPGLPGYDVLAELKSDSALRRIPVVIFSGSTDEDDVDRAYDLQAAAFVAKPPSLEGFVELIALLRRYAGTTLKLPNR